MICIKINFTSEALFDGGLTCKEMETTTKALTLPKLVANENQLTNKQLDPSDPRNDPASYLESRFTELCETKIVLHSQLFDNSFCGMLLNINVNTHTLQLA